MSNRILNNSFFILFVGMLFIGCKGQSFSEDKFMFDSVFRKCFAAIVKSDTIYFENSKNSVDTFVLTKLDSFVINPNQSFCLICPSPGKTVYRKYKQYPIDYWSQPKVENGKTNYEVRDDETLISISKNPLDGVTTMHLSFKNFVGMLQTNLDKLYTDTLQIEEKYFTNYYIVHTYAINLVKRYDDVEFVYVTPADGIIAYREKSGILRKRMLR